MFLDYTMAMPAMPSRGHGTIDIAVVCNTGDTALLTSWVCSSVCPARARHRLTDRDGQTETDTPRQTDRDK